MEPSKRPSVRAIDSDMKVLLTFTALLCIPNSVTVVEAWAPFRSTSRFVAEPRLPAFFQPVTSASRPIINRRRAGGASGGVTTELSMGLRSILGKVRKNKGDDHSHDKESSSSSYDDDDDDYIEPPKKQSVRPSARPTTPKLPEDEAPPVKAETKKKLPLNPLELSVKVPLRMGEDPDSKEINVNTLDQAESVQERINRVKSGKMTQEEKKAFLNAALSTGNTPETRLPLRPPAAPPMEIEDNKSSRVSPFPEDPILRSIAGGKQPAPAKLSNQLVDKAGADSQKKKREYLDMVTDPHRFDVFRTQPYNARNPSSAMTGQIGSALGPQQNQQQAPYDFQIPAQSPVAQQYQQQQQINNAYLPVPEIPATAPPSPPATTSQAETSSSVSPDVTDGYPSTDLGTRLEAAAIAQEQQKKQLTAQQREEQMRKRKEEEEKKRAATEKAAEEERRRQEILAEREKIYRERRREEEEAAQREKAKEKEAEEKRLKALLEAQESYWQQKLARERELREKRLQEESGTASEEAVASAPSQPAAPYVSPSMPEPPRSSPSLGGNNLSKHVFNPDESNILGDKAFPKQGEKPSAPKSKPAPSYLNDVASSGVPYTSRRPSGRPGKTDVKDEQLRRLRELNSPIPKREPTSRYDEKTRSPSASFQPQRPVTQSRPIPTPSPSTAASAVNGSQKVNGSVNGSSFQASPHLRQPRPPPSYTPPPPASAPTNPLNDIFGGTQSSPAPAPRPAPAPASASPPPPPPPPTERKGPIRMQLPLDNGEEDGWDEEEGIDVRSNTKMSILDVMKKSGGSDGDVDPDERSKKWGIDMSKFM